MWSARPFNSDSPDPFGRDIGKAGDDLLSAESSKCPSCASNIFYQPELQGMVCRNCGNIYKPSTLEKIGSLGYSIEHDYTSDNEISGDDRKRHEIVCDSCGATMIADENTMSTMCPFCGSPALITRRMTREFKPDYIVPFKIDRKTAEINMRNWLKTRKMTPRGFKTKSRLTKMTAIYVPFWLVDCCVNSDLAGTGKSYTKKIVSTYAVTSNVSYYVKGVPFDASLKIANKLMEAIEPFDYSELVKFDNRYLQGFAADKYDQRPTEIMERFVKRMERMSQEMNGRIAAKYDAYEPSPEKSFTWMSDFNIRYCLLPVWFMTVEFDGRQYQFAVNGQTGEASGQVPTTSAVDKMESFVRFTRSNMKWVPIAAAVLLAVILFGIVLSGDMSTVTMYIVLALCAIELLIIVSAVVIFVMSFFAKHASRGIHKTADPVNDFDKDPGLDSYLDTTRPTNLKTDDFLLRHEDIYEDEEKEKEHIDVPFELY